MPAVRITLVKNIQQKLRSAVVLNYDVETDLRELVLTTAKNKLRIKKASRIFFNGVELADSKDISETLVDGCELYISSGEDYIGAVSLPTTKTFIVDVIILADASYVEPDALAQLRQTASLPGMYAVIGQPDLHPGNTYPVGATFITEGIIYPALIGNDIGCGMCLYKTKLSSDIQTQKIADRIHGIEGPWMGNTTEWLSQFNAHPTPFDDTLGTIGICTLFLFLAHLAEINPFSTKYLISKPLQSIRSGGGNHFAELQKFDEILDQNEFDRHGLQADRAYLLVHSGSRRYGQSILDGTTAQFKHAGLPISSGEGQAYMKQHDEACRWARANRELIARRILESLGAAEGTEKILDIWHNNVCQKMFDDGRELLVHRKGAAPSDCGLIVIPGSRGAHTYLVVPTGDQQRNGFSVAHGAGRKWTRAKALRTHKSASKKDSVKMLQTTQLGGTVICDDGNLLFEEQPDAYKEIEEIIEDLTQKKIVKVVAILRPIVTYKMRKE